jgi:hypothetical protein
MSKAPFDPKQRERQRNIHSFNVSRGKDHSQLVNHLERMNHIRQKQKLDSLNYRKKSNSMFQ